jgi:hypothetical protein
VAPEQPRAASQGLAFHPVAAVATSEDERAPHVRLFEAAGSELFATVGPQLVRIGADGAFERDPMWLRGIEPLRDEGALSLAAIVTWDAIAAGGRWPDAFYVTVSAEFSYRGSDNPHWVYRRQGDRWIALKTRGDHFHWFVADIAPWKDGSVLALKGFQPIHEYRGEYELAEPTKASMRRAKAAIDRQKPLVVIRGAGKAPDLRRRDIAAIDALPSGEIVGVVEGETPVAVHFDPTSGAVTERALPKRTLADAEVLLEGSARAWIHGRIEGHPGAPYLVRFDGESWIEDATPPCENAGIGSLARTPDGDAWAVCGYPPDTPLFQGEPNSLWHRPADAGAWEPAKLPDGAVPTEVVARSRDDVWVAGNGLWHTRPRDAVAKVPGYTDLWLDAIEREDPVPPFSCQDGTILVEGSPTGEHEDLVAELTRVLADRGDDGGGSLSLVEVAFRGEQRLALHYHSIDRKTADRIRQVLGPRLLEAHCLYRDPTRELGSW